MPPARPVRLLSSDVAAPGGTDELVAAAASVAGGPAPRPAPRTSRSPCGCCRARPRARLLALYDYARFVDDVGDAAYAVGGRPATPADRLALLGLVDADLDAPEPGLGPVRGLAPLLAEGVPVQPFHDLVEANRVDQTVTSYPGFGDLVGYCRLSADPVGRVVLHVADAATPRTDRVVRRRVHRPAGARALPGRGGGRRPRPHLPARGRPRARRRNATRPWP